MIRCLLAKLTWLSRFSAISISVLVVGVSATDTIDFNRDIRPILSEHCFLCHGPDESHRKGGLKKTGGLRLDTEEGARMDLGGHSAVVPGKVEESELIYLITTEDEDDRMPPRKEDDRLNSVQIALLKQWIKEGAPYDVHWAYKKPIRSDLPEIDSVKFTLKNPIDHFIAKRLEAEALTQSSEADRSVLARRVALDLTGLPPTLEEADDFRTDPSPDAFDRFVQQQLDKPAYGEHWARLWLDLGRYADSAGYADDPLRTIWGFRDYVIRSFNENKPFDQFTIEQIAGDLLESPSIDQLVATAFHRNTKTNSEGGTSDEEFRNEAVVDRVNTTMAVWMGTTIDCAQCHTHKYDPITQEEYFKLFAIFNSTADEDRTDEKPWIPLYSEKQKREKAELESALFSLRKSLNAKLNEKVHQRRRWIWENELRMGTGWHVLRPLPVNMNANSKAAMTIDEQGNIEIGENSAPQDTYIINSDSLTGSGSISGVKLEVLAQGAPWVLNELEVRRIDVDGEDDSRQEAESEEPEESKTRIPRLKLTHPTATFEEEWYGAKDAIDGNTGNRFSGWAVDGNLAAANEAVFELEEPVAIPAGTQLQIKLHHNFPDKKIKRFRLFISQLPKPFPAVPMDLNPALKKPVEKRTAQEESALLDFFSHHDPESKSELTRIAELEKRLEAIEPLTTVPVMREVSENRLRKTHIQHRGNFLDKGKEVFPGTPAVFHPLPEDRKPDRLTLAHWLVDPDNPLTARVVANRYWEAIFGIGIVSTGEEFGSQGELPSHPELLDWLALELIESGWDLKHLLKLLVTSAAYRQSSKVSPEQYALDPDNRLLSRGPRFRISAEMVRDQALAVSGLLNSALLGPSVKPPQPKLGLKAAFGSETDWMTSEGPDKHRRGIYTFWRRSNPYPSMVAFDAPNREFCTLRRVSTNTPLQALVTLNDPVYIEASQALGRRMEGITGSIGQKVAYGFRLCLIREPSEKEIYALVQLFQEIRSRYLKEPDRAHRMATDPIGPLPVGAGAAEFAAWTIVGNALLNLDELFLKP